MRTPRLLFLLPVATAMVLFTGACSSGDDTASDDVATLGGDSSDDSTADDSTAGGNGGRQLDPEFQDAMVDFAECMREHGVDMPDPQIDGDGGGVIIAGPAGGRGGEPPSEADMEAMDAANEACQHILEEVEGSMPQLDPEQQEEMQQQALEFAQCMREHGIDMPDPVFSDGGRMTVEVGGGDGEGRTGPAFDPNDDDFQEAAEACGQEGGFGFSAGASSAGTDDGNDSDDGSDG